MQNALSTVKKSLVCNFYNPLIHRRSHLSLVFILILQLTYFTRSQVIWDPFISLKTSWGMSHRGEMMMTWPPGSPYLSHHLQWVHTKLALGFHWAKALPSLAFIVIWFIDEDKSVLSKDNTEKMEKLQQRQCWTGQRPQCKAMLQGQYSVAKGQYHGEQGLLMPALHGF